MSRVQCGGCIVHCVLCVRVSTCMRCNSFSPFNRTKDRSRRWSWSLKNKRFNVNIPLMQTAWAVQLFGRFRCTKIWFTSDAIQSSLLAALGSVLRRLRSISELSVCVYVCMFWFVSASMRCNNLFFFSKLLRNAVSKVQCGGCLVHCALCFVCERVCVNTHVGQQLLLFNETKDRSQRGYTLTLVFEQQV